MEEILEATSPTKIKSPSTFDGIARQTLKRARQGQLGVARQLAEMVILKLVYGLGPGYYHSARLWRSELPWSFKTGFWPYKKFRRFISTINPPAYQKLSQNKLSEKAILSLVHLPTATFLGHLHHQYGLSRSGKKLNNAHQLGELLMEHSTTEKLCFKLVEGFGGQGFHAAQVIRDGDIRLRVLDSGEILTLHDVVEKVLQVPKGQSYIIEEYVHQHPLLTALNPSSVNTVRVWAACSEGESWVIDAFLRVGRRGSLVDNTSRGAQIFRLDLVSGVIGEGMSKDIYNETYHCHADSGEQISGRALPYWQDALLLAQKAVMAFPCITFAGVDVAFSENGPVIIELNVEPDPTSAIIFDRCHEELFSRFFKSHKR